MRRIGAQVRYLFLDDIAGDPITCVSGAQLFYVPTRNMRDVSSPYHGQVNLQWGVCLGKEIDRGALWLARFETFFAVGIANRGAPWFSAFLTAKFQWGRSHQVHLFSEGLFGFGHRDVVDLSRFYGYGNIGHHSIDLGVGYRYLLGVWGSFTARYGYRVYARAFPQNVHAITLQYELPFSFF